MGERMSKEIRGRDLDRLLAEAQGVEVEDKYSAYDAELALDALLVALAPRMRMDPDNTDSSAVLEALVEASAVDGSILTFVEKVFDAVKEGGYGDGTRSVTYDEAAEAYLKALALLEEYINATPDDEEPDDES
jgi:hypothetical protein